MHTHLLTIICIIHLLSSHTHTSQLAKFSVHYSTMMWSAPSLILFRSSAPNVWTFTTEVTCEVSMVTLWRVVLRELVADYQ